MGTQNTKHRDKMPGKVEETEKNEWKWEFRGRASISQRTRASLPVEFGFAKHRTDDVAFSKSSTRMSRAWGGYRGDQNHVFSEFRSFLEPLFLNILRRHSCWS